MNTRQHGVTLIELLIVVAIAGIIAAVAMPAYQDYVMRGKLADAHSILGATRTRLEQYYQDNRSYPVNCGGTAAGLPALTNFPPTSTYFTYGCASNGTAGQTFLLTASGTGATAGFGFTIDDQGNRATSAVPPSTAWSRPSPNTCWVQKKGGIC